MAAADYFDVVQKLYIAFYQRPADPGGLRFWAQRIDGSGGDISQAWDAFAAEPEAVRLYGTINSGTVERLVDQIYRALFNRPAETAGRDFYVSRFLDGRYTAAEIAFRIIDGAQNDDARAITNKVIVANRFTAIVDGRPLEDPAFGTGGNFAATYDRSDEVVARTLLLAVNSNDATVRTVDQVRQDVISLIADAGDSLIPVDDTPSGFQNFTLTADADSPLLASGNNTITANNNDHLQATDSIAAGDGTDTIVFGGAQDLVDLQFTNVSSVEQLRFLAGSTTGHTLGPLAAAAGVQSVALDNAAASLSAFSLGRAISVAGSAFADSIQGSQGFNDTLIGGAGDDTLLGGEGDDLISGGDDADSLIGNDDHDTIYGGGGNDTITGGDDNDVINAGAGDNVVTDAGWEDDTIVHDTAGSTVAVSVLGLTGSVTVIASQPGATVTSGANVNSRVIAATSTVGVSFAGGNGNDSFVGGAGNDTLSGGDRNDTLAGGSGADELSGGVGDNTYVFADGVAAGELVTFAASAGTEVFRIDAATDFTLLNSGTPLVGLDVIQLQNVNATFRATQLSGLHVQITDQAGGASGQVTMSHVGGVSATVIDARNITVDANARLRITSVGNNDTVYGSTVSATRIEALGGNQSLIGGNGNDHLQFDGGNATLVGGGGDDYLQHDAGNATLVGGAGADTLTGNTGRSLFQFAGATEIAGDVTIDGGIDIDTLQFTSATTLVDSDFIKVAANSIEAVVLADGGNSLTMGTAVAAATQFLTIRGGTGSDTINASALGEALTVEGDLGADSLTGTSGADTFRYSGAVGSIGPSTSAAKDTIVGLDASDVLVLNLTNVRTFEVSVDVMVTATTYIADTDSDGGNTGSADVLIDLQSAITLTDAQARTMTVLIADGTTTHDSISGGAGNDSISGGAGADTLQGGDGNDLVQGGWNADSIVSGAGVDTVDGGPGSDTLAYTTFVSFVSGGTVIDSIIGGPDSDTIRIDDPVTLTTAHSLARVSGVEVLLAKGTAGTTSIVLDADEKLGSIRTFTLGTGVPASTLGFSGVTVSLSLMTRDGDDTITAGNGNDTVEGGLGADRLTGGTGADTFMYSGAIGSVGPSNSSARDTIVGVDAADVIVLSLTGVTEFDVAVDVTATATNYFADTNGDGVTTGSADIVLDLVAPNVALDSDAARAMTVLVATGTDGNDSILGGSGADTLEGGWGADSLAGGNGADTFVYSITIGSVSPSYGSSKDLIADLNPTDTIRLDLDQVNDFELGTDVRGSAASYFADTNGDGVLTGSSDLVIDLPSSVSLTDTQAIAITILFARGTGGNDTIAGGAGNDFIGGFTGMDILHGWGGDDTVVGNSGNDTVRGGDGNDVLEGGSGDDVVDGGNGDDLLWGGSSGNDSLTGSAGADQFRLTGTNAGVTITDFSRGHDKIALANATGGAGGGSPDFTVAESTAGVPLLPADFDRVDTIAFVRSDKGGVGSGNHQVFLVSAAQTTMEINTAVSNGALSAFVFVYNSTANAAELYFDSDWSDAMSPVKVATFAGLGVSDVQALGLSDFWAWVG